MSETRDLEFFMNNPDQIASSMGEIAGLIGDGEGGGEGQELATTGEVSAASGAVSNEVVKDQVQEPAAEQNAVVKSKDGKHEIPYQVLQNEREARRGAEAAMEQMRQRLDALEQAAKTGQATPESEAAGNQEDLSEDDLAQISEDFPAVGKLLKSMATRVDQLNQQLSEVRQSEQSRRSEEATRASSSVQEAIDSNATLSYWQQQDPEMFKVAVQFDNQIKADPRNQSLSLDERFQKVTNAVEAVYGKAELPAQYQRSPQPQAKADPNAVAAAAQKVIDSTPSAPAVRSLSDIPGGVPPASDEMTQMGMMSSADLGNKLLSMTEAQVLALLARAA